MPTGYPSQIKIINGVLMKFCCGPAHRGGKWIPITEFRTRYTLRTHPENLGAPRPHCKWCESARVGSERYVDVAKVRWIFIELQDRLGKRETARRLGRSVNWLWKFNHGRHLRMRADTVRRGIQLLREVRATNEVRHRDSIIHGAAARGRKEKVPQERKDFYASQSKKQNAIDSKRGAKTKAQREREAASL
jgi:hypothetical protein